MVAVKVASVLLLAALVAVSAQQQRLSLAPDDCTAFTYSNLSNKFSYTARLSVDGPNSTCVSVSKLYIEGACIKDRNNEFGFDTAKQLTCASADDPSTQTCNTVFNTAPSQVVSGNSITANDFDSGDVCSNDKTGYFYVKSNCTQSEDVTLTFTVSNYKGGVGSCVAVAGHHLSGVAIALIVVVVLIALVLLSICFCWCCCCCR